MESHRTSLRTMQPLVLVGNAESGSMRSKIEEMKENRITPDVISYSTAISACETYGQWQVPLQLLKEMKANRVSPNIFSYNGAVSACAKAGNWQLVLKLIEEMKKEGIKPDAITYNVAISVCENSGQWEHVVSLLGMLQKEGIAPDVISYGAAITAAKNGGQWERVIKLFEEMKEAKVALDDVLVKAASTAYEKCGKTQCAVDLIKEMKIAKLRKEGITPWKEALELFQELKNSKNATDILSYNAILKSFLEDKQWHLVIEVFKHVKEIFAPDILSRYHVMRALEQLECLEVVSVKDWCTDYFEEKRGSLSPESGQDAWEQKLEKIRSV